MRLRDNYLVINLTEFSNLGNAGLANEMVMESQRCLRFKATVLINLINGTNREKINSATCI